MNPLTSSPTTSQPNRATSAAQQEPGIGNLVNLLSRVPAVVQLTSRQAGRGFRQLSTTQKVVGGALLALGLGYLARRRKGRTGAAEALHELLPFVNDRIAGYERAAAESQDAELRGYYQQLVSQSQQFANTLNSYLTREGQGRETGTTLKGKLYRAWMDAQAALTGRDEPSILAANIYGEEWAINAYQQALAVPALSGEMRQAVERQRYQAQQTYQRLRQLEHQQQAAA